MDQEQHQGSSTTSDNNQKLNSQSTATSTSVQNDHSTVKSTTTSSTSSSSTSSHLDPPPPHAHVGPTSNRNPISLFHSNPDVDISSNNTSRSASSAPGQSGEPLKMEDRSEQHVQAEVRGSGIDSRDSLEDKDKRGKQVSIRFYDLFLVGTVP